MSEIDWEKRARDIFRPEHVAIYALQFAREMADAAANKMMRLMDHNVRVAADERAEEIAKAIEGANISVYRRGLDGTAIDIGVEEAIKTCATLARSFVSKPRTREQVLEEALKEIEAEPTRFSGMDEYLRRRLHEHVCRALEWRPEHP